MNNPQDPKVPVNEEIVARLGKLIDVAVCDPMLVRIPSALVGWEFHPGRKLEEGWVHGSRAVSYPVIELHDLRHRAEDDNARRHAGFVALYDWLCGQDEQWLVADQAQNMYWSHDHGHYLPAGPGWTIASLNARKDDPVRLAGDTVGLDAGELERLASAIETVSAAEISAAIAELPVEWPVDDSELDALVAFATYRRAGVAARLRSLI